MFLRYYNNLQCTTLCYNFFQVIKNYIIAILIIASITLVVRIAIFIFRQIRWNF